METLTKCALFVSKALEAWKEESNDFEIKNFRQESHPFTHEEAAKSEGIVPVIVNITSNNESVALYTHIREPGWEEVRKDENGPRLVASMAIVEVLMLRKRQGEILDAWKKHLSTEELESYYEIADRIWNRLGVIFGEDRMRHLAYGIYLIGITSTLD